MAATTLRRLHATVGQMQKNLECSICLDLLRDPVSTKCDHQFCSFCIKSLLAARRKPSAPCPLCKEPITKRSLTKNERMNEIVSAVRGVADAIEQDTGIRCTPPKGPPRLSQSSSQSSSSTPTQTNQNHTETQATTTQKKNKPKGRAKQNVRRTQSRQPPQQVHVYIDSDQSDSDGHERQLTTSNTNISSSFPVPTRGKGKKGRKQSARKPRGNQQGENEPSNVSRNNVSSNNAHNSLLNALGSGTLGRTLPEQVAEDGRVTEHNEPSTGGHKKASSGDKEDTLLEVLDGGSLGMSKDNPEARIDPNEEVPNEENSLPGNTELVADIFGLSPSSQNQKRTEKEQDIVELEDNDTCDPDEDNGKPPVAIELQSTENKDIYETQVQNKTSGMRSVTRANIFNGKENSLIPPEGDPYEFIPSQRTPRKVKSKPGRKKKKTGQLAGGVSYTSGKLKFGKKGTGNSQVVGSQKTTGAAPKRKTGVKKSGRSDTAKEIIVIDDDETAGLEAVEETEARKAKAINLKSDKTKQQTGSKMDTNRDEMLLNDDNNCLTSPCDNQGPDTGITELPDLAEMSPSEKNPQEDSPSKDTGNMRIEGLFASQATNDSIDPNEDRGLPLYDYGDSSDEDSPTLCSDGSYRPGGRVLRRRGTEMKETDKRLTRRQKQREAKEVENKGNDADDSSTSAGEGGPLLRKRKNVKTSERRSTRRRNKQSSDVSLSEDNHEDAELEVSYIQEHLQECDDETLYVDGDSQRAPEDKKGRHQKVKKASVSTNVSPTKTNEKQQQEVSEVDDDRDEEENQQDISARSTNNIGAKSSKSSHSSESNKVVPREGQENQLSDGGEEPVIIEDSEKHDTVPNKTTSEGIHSSTKEINDPFKKPSTIIPWKSRTRHKSKQDWITISKTTSKKKNQETNQEVESFNQKTDSVKQFQDPDDDELTLVDSQRERKKRSPGAAKVFFRAYKRGSIRLDTSAARLEGDEDDEDDDDTTFADVFGDDALEHRDDVEPDSGGHEEEEMDISDVQEQSESDEDVIEIAEQKTKDEQHQKESNINLGTVKETLPVRPNQHLPTHTCSDKLGAGKEEEKKTTRKSSRERKGRSKSENPSELQQLNTNKKLSPEKSHRASHPLAKKQLEKSSGVTERSRRSAKKSKADADEVEDLSEISGGVPVKESAAKDVESAKRSSRSRSRDDTSVNKMRNVEMAPNQIQDLPAASVKPQKAPQQIENVPRNSKISENKQETAGDIPIEIDNQDQKCNNKGSVQENVTPIKSDWEIALELAREFDTEPRQFRLRGGQRLSDELAGSKTSRGSSRKKPELSLSTVSATSHTRDLPHEELSQSQCENVEDIDSFTTEDSESVKSGGSQVNNARKSLKDQVSAAQASSKKRDLKKTTPQSKKILHDREFGDKCKATDEATGKTDNSNCEKEQKVFQEKGTKKKKKTTEQRKESGHIQEPKMTIPETPLLPVINLVDSVEPSNLVSGDGVERRSLRGRGSLKTPEGTKEDSLTLSGVEESNRKTSAVENAVLKAVVSPKIIPQTPLPDSINATTFDQENDMVIEESETFPKKRTQSSTIPSNMTDDSTDNDEVQATSLKDKNKKSPENRRSKRRFGRQVNTSQSGDVEVIDVKTTKSRDRVPSTSGTSNTALLPSSDAEVTDHETSRNTEKRISQTHEKESDNERASRSKGKVLTQHSRRRQRTPMSSDTEKDVDSSASRERTKNLKGNHQGDNADENSKRASRSRSLRSRKGSQVLQSSETESTDHDDLKDKKRVIKSQERLKKKKISPINGPLRRSGKGKGTPQSSDAESTNLEYARTPKMELEEVQVFTPPSNKKLSRSHPSKVDTPQDKNQHHCEKSSKSGMDNTMESSTTRAKSSVSHPKSNRNSPRLSATSPSANSKEKSKLNEAVLPSANSGTLFSEEEDVSKKDGGKMTDAANDGKGGDTTESIELEVSSEEYEQENPEVQVLAQQANHKEDIQLQPAVTSIEDQNVTSRRRRNKLTRNRNQHSDDSSTKTTESSTSGIWSVSTTSDNGETVDTNTVKPTPQPTRKSFIVTHKEQQQQLKKEEVKERKLEKKDEKKLTPSVSGSETESLCSPQGSDSDIFRYSDMSPLKAASGNSDKLEPSEKETLTTKVHVVVQDIAKETNTSPHLGSIDLATCGSSLESEPLLVLPPSHYQENFVPKKATESVSKKAFVSETTVVDESQEGGDGGERRRSKRKSFALGSSPACEQQSKKRKSGEIDETSVNDDHRQDEEMRSPVVRRSGRRSSQGVQSQNGLERLATKKVSASSIDTKRKSQPRCLEVDPKDAVDDSTIAASVIQDELDLDVKSDSLQTKRRSRTSGSRHGSYTNSPRHNSAVLSADDEVPSGVNTVSRKNRQGKVERGVDQSPSTKTKRGQRLSPAMPNDGLVTSPRRSARMRHSSKTGSIIQQDEVPSQATTSTPQDDEDYEFANSGSLFGTQDGNQQEKQRSTSSQTAVEEKTSDPKERSEFQNDDEQDISGSQCMFDSDPNSSSEHDVEMMSEGSDEDDKVEESHALQDTKIPHLSEALYSEETCAKTDPQVLKQPCTSNLQRQRSPEQVTTIPNSAPSVNGTARKESPRSKSKNEWKNSIEGSGTKSKSSGSASTCISASEDASVSPDKLSEPIPLGKRKKGSIEHSGHQSRSSGSNKQSQNSAGSRKSRRGSSGKSVIDDENILKHKKGTINDVSSNSSKGKYQTRGEKMKPQKLSDINLCDSDVDGDHDLLFEEDEVMTLTPVISNGEKEEMTSHKVRVTEKDASDEENEDVQSETCGTEHLPPTKSSPCQHSKDGVTTEKDEDALLENDDVEDSRKEMVTPNDVQDVPEPMTNKEVIEEDGEESDGEAMEVGSDEDLDCEEMEEKDSQVEEKRTGDVQQDAGVNDIDDEVEDTEEEEDEDDLIPPTPPCANTTVSSFSKSHVASKSFLSSFQYQATNRSTQSNSSSSNSFSNQSGKSFVFKHPSATHSQRIVKPKPSGRNDSVMESGEEFHPGSVTPKHAISSKPSSRDVEVSKEPQSLEESQSLSIFHNAADTEIDLNALPEKSQKDNSRQTPKSKSQTRQEKSSTDVSDEEEVASKQEHNYVKRTHTKRNRRKRSGVKSQHRDDELMACPFLSEEENIPVNEPEINAEDKDQDVSSPAVAVKPRRRKTNDASKSSTSDEKEYDTEASLCSESSSSTSHHLNLTSASSVMSSQSEVMSTQQQLKAQETLKKMQQEIYQMEAVLGHGEQVEPPVLASDSEEEAKHSDSDSDESQTELASKLPQDEDDDNAVALSDDDEDLAETIDPREEELENQDAILPQKQSKSRESSGKQMNTSKRKMLSEGSSRRSQRLVYSDEEEEENYETVNHNDDVDSDSTDKALRNLKKSASSSKNSTPRSNGNRQNGSSKVPPSCDNSDNDDEPLDACPRSPSPPPPLTQGTMQRYTSRTPLQETLQNVTKLAEQFKSGSSGSANSRKRPVSRHRRRESDSSDDGVASGSNRSRKRQSPKELQYKKLSSTSDSSDEDVSRRNSQRRKVKRRLRSESDSSDEEPTSLRKSARSSRNSTPRSAISSRNSTPRGSGSSTKKNNRNSFESVRKSVNNLQDQSLDSDRTQITHNGSQPNSARNTQNDSQRSSSKKDVNSSKMLPRSSPRVIENSLPESSRNTQRTSQERDAPSKGPSNGMAVSQRSSARVPDQGSPIMELGCKRTLLQEDSAPVVAKNLRKNDGRFSFVATGLSRQELREVERLTKLTGCKFASMFNANTTHVIINTDEDLVCERTLKYFQGIAARVWIISYRWVEACLKTGDLLPEEGFEIQGDVVNGKKHGGPEKARMWRDKPLMHNYEICSVGPYTGLNKDQLVSLLELCGSTTVQHPTLFPFDVGHQFYIVVQQNCQHTQEDYDALYKKYRVPVISREWVLDSVATYSLQPIEDYLLSGDQQPIIDLDSDME